MVEPSQKRAIKTYRDRLVERGMTRFDVLGRDTDRELIRALARRLTESDPDAAQIRATVRRSLAGTPARKGGILEALRRSPLVDTDLDLARSRENGRKIDL